MSTDPGEQRQNLIIIVASVAVVLVLLLGLFVYLQQSGDDEQPAAETTSSPTVESTPSDDADEEDEEESTESEADPSDDRGDLPGQDDIEKASKESAEARKTAAKVIDGMAKTDQSTTKWRKSLTPMFTEQGRTQIEAMTPKSVKFGKRTGEATLVLSGGRAEGQFPISVDTDKGMWLVQMVEDDDGKWRALSVSQYDSGQQPEAPA